MRNQVTSNLKSQGDAFARRVFTWAPLYGLLVLPPQFLSEWFFTRTGRPPEQHPEYLYGFVTAALVSQLLYWTIGRDPVRYRPIMPIAVLAKLAFFVPAAALFAFGRVEQPTFWFATVDLVLGALFAIAWHRTAAEG